jgi:hypothetical protein
VENLIVDCADYALIKQTCTVFKTVEKWYQPADLLCQIVNYLVTVGVFGPYTGAIAIPY